MYVETLESRALLSGVGMNHGPAMGIDVSGDSHYVQVPFKLRGEGVMGPGVASSTGSLTHFGRYEMTGSIIWVDPDNPMHVHLAGVMIASNGDSVSLVSDAFLTPDPATGKIVLTQWVIPGTVVGTGRFEGVKLEGQSCTAVIDPATGQYTVSDDNVMFVLRPGHGKPA